MSHTFKVGDLVDVYDLRDGACVDRRAKIEKIEDGTVSTGKVYAILSCGYGVSVRCLKPAATPQPRRSRRAVSAVALALREAAKIGARIRDAERDVEEISAEQRDNGVWGGAPVGLSLDASVRRVKSCARLERARGDLDKLIANAEEGIS